MCLWCKTDKREWVLTMRRTNGSGHGRYGDFCGGYTDTIGHEDGNGGGFRSCGVGGDRLWLFRQVVGVGCVVVAEGENGGREQKPRPWEYCTSAMSTAHKWQPWFRLEKEGGKTMFSLPSYRLGRS
ncbi:pollen-specific leucine-rich repeat extensin-like protein 3 [Iris pallida]|uniref:Pollen-specific leucine-rich repeat extensin-like protein 3 n=1 Tax=Iris pallida TaxID=29817 RepID=A0AAX6HKS1_IRIPA|nr:pollen-specific leucine-rich repeat extensin-like protein 3 [Iris pallida]